MQLRVCEPELVPGTMAHGVHVDAPSHFVNRIEFGPSLLITNSHTLVPSVAPNKPPLTVPLAGFIDWLAPKAGGAGDKAAHAFVAVLYEAPATTVPPELLRRNA